MRGLIRFSCFAVVAGMMSGCQNSNFEAERYAELNQRYDVVIRRDIRNGDCRFADWAFVSLPEVACRRNARCAKRVGAVLPLAPFVMLILSKRILAYWAVFLRRLFLRLSIHLDLDIGCVTVTRTTTTLTDR